MTHQSSETHWVSLSDMMTGLMMVFLFISILFMHQWQKEFVSYQNNKNSLYKELNNQFKEKYKEWDMILEKDLTIKFTNPEVLFDYRSAEITPKFSMILSEFIPQYLAIITKEKYKDSISEVRIDGHTADWDDYMYTIQLSQERSNSVLKYILNSQYFFNIPEGEKNLVKFWMTSNGLGNGRALDETGKYVFETKKQTSAGSRRVEFRIVTRSEELIDKVIKNNLN